jgi:hypothetical protein
MISMMSTGKGRPNIPEYQAIAVHVRQALDEVFHGIKEPKQALDDAAAKSAKVLGWSPCASKTNSTASNSDHIAKVAVSRGLQDKFLTESSPPCSLH